MNRMYNNCPCRFCPKFGQARGRCMQKSSGFSVGRSEGFGVGRCSFSNMESLQSAEFNKEKIHALEARIAVLEKEIEILRRD